MMGKFALTVNQNRRLMRQHGLQAPSRVGHPHGPKAHDGTIITEQPDVISGTDAIL